MVVDFSEVELGSILYLCNIEDQISGAGPTGKTLTLDEAPKIIQFIVNRGAGDPSRVPATMREIPVIPAEEITVTRRVSSSTTRTACGRSRQEVRLHPIDLQVQQGATERWILRNTSIDWEHPVHIHLEEHQVITRNGLPPEAYEAGRKDVTTLGPGDEVVIHIRFRDFEGRYPIHCHNTVHEDHAMMLRWDVVK